MHDKRYNLYFFFMTKRVTKRLEVYLETGRKAPCLYIHCVVADRLVGESVSVRIQATTDLLDI